jgi:hypothetical protein
MKNRLELFLAALTDEQLHLIERAILEIANHGETSITFPKEVNDIADDLLNY